MRTRRQGFRCGRGQELPYNMDAHIRARRELVIDVGLALTDVVRFRT